MGRKVRDLGSKMEPTLVINLKPPQETAMKPSELIHISGHQNLSLYARRAITILWHNAHKQGIEEHRDYTIPLADLRTDGHKGTEVLKDAIRALMTSILEVRSADGTVETQVQFLGGNDLTNKDRPEGMLTYSFDKRLVQILRYSEVWGQLDMPVLMAFSNKYAVSLYENVAQLSGLDYKTTQQFTLEEFRALLGVEEGKYPRFGNLRKEVITKAVEEINALARFNITVLPVKTGKRVTHIKLGWWIKSQEELKEAYQELDRPKAGRRARIAGSVERVAPTPRVEEQLRKNRLARQVIDPEE